MMLAEAAPSSTEWFTVFTGTRVRPRLSYIFISLDFYCMKRVRNEQSVKIHLSYSPLTPFHSHIKLIDRLNTLIQLAGNL